MPLPNTVPRTARAAAGPPGGAVRARRFPRGCASPSVQASWPRLAMLHRLGHTREAKIELHRQAARPIRTRLSAAVSPVRRWVKQSGNLVQPAISARRSVIRPSGVLA